MADKTIDILLRFVTDSSSDEELNGAIVNVYKHFDQLQQKIEQTRRSAQQLKVTAEQLGQVSQMLTAFGTVTTAGIFAAGAKYVKDAKQATETTIEWKRAQEELNHAAATFGEVAATTALPVLKEAAKIANQTAGFVKEHPDLVKVALNAGLVTATLGAVGMLVSKGIRFYADLQLLGAFIAEKQAASEQQRAALVMLAASENMLKAAGLEAEASALKNSGKGTSLLGAGGLSGAIATPLGVTALLAANLVGAKGISDNLDKLSKTLDDFKKGTGDIFRTVSSALIGLTPAGPFVQIVDTLKFVANSINGIANKFGNSGSSSSGTIGGRTPDTGDIVRTTYETLQQAAKLYQDYKQDDLELVRQHYQERQGIIEDALQQEQDANKQYAAAVAKVNSGESSALAKAAADFNAANLQATQQYATDQAKIERDGAEEIAKIRQQSQERLRKLEQDHNDRVESLTASRDALGLAKEKRDYNRQVAEEKRDTQQEIKDRRRDIAQRLADLKQSYEQERAQRLAEYQARVEEIKQQAAERLAELAQEHAEELQKIQEQKVAKLRELDAQFTAERQRRYQYFLAQIRDLDAALLGETRLRQQYQVKMLQDLQTFLNQYSTNLSTGLAGAIPHNAAGGYTSGLTWTGEQGVEYIMSNRTVQAAESIIGGRLTQEGLIAAMSGRGGGQNNTLNFNGRFDGSYTAEMKRAVEGTVRKVFHQEFKALMA